MLGTVNPNPDIDEELFLGTAESEHVEMYLKAIWHIREKKEKVKVSSIAKIFWMTLLISSCVAVKSICKESQ